MINESFKLRNVSIKYSTNVITKVITATCYFDSILGEIKATGYAKCGKGDKFNKAKGRKIARARAELNAYATYRERLFNYKCELMQKFQNTTDKLSDCIDHQIGYINDIK